MNTGQELICEALRKRSIEVCTRAGALNPSAFGGLADFVSRQQKSLAEAIESGTFRNWEISNTWLSCEVGCLAALQVLSLDEELRCSASDPPAIGVFFQQLQGASSDPGQRFQLLTDRYSHPLNFAAPTESLVQEHLLERLMVSDRARIERHSIDAVNADDLLLKLNLLAIKATLAADLRFLDALNYFYELLPANWYPKSEYSWLLISFWAFYARALTIHSGWIRCA